MWRSLLVVFSLVLLVSAVAFAQAPSCDSPRETDTYSVGGRTISLTGPPIAYTACPAEGCCDTFTSSGLAGTGWSIRGLLVIQEVYSYACDGGDPLYCPNPVFPLDLPCGRKIIGTVQINTATNPSQLKNGELNVKVCYPSSHEWGSFELHIDVWLGVHSAEGVMLAPIGMQNGWDLQCYGVGCTPGFWKNHCQVSAYCQQFLTWPGGYTPDTLFSTVFGVVALETPTLTLMQALDAPGNFKGKNQEANMVFQAVAALLSAAWAAENLGSGNCGAFGSFTVAAVIQLVQQAETSKNFTEIGGMFSLANQTLCPYNNVWMGTNISCPMCGAPTAECPLPGSPCNPFF